MTKSKDKVEPADAPKSTTSPSPVTPAAETGKPPAERPLTARDQVQRPKAHTVEIMRGKRKVEPADAPLYRATKKHYLNGRIVEAGAEVRYAGIPGTGLEPLDDAAKEARAAADKERARRKKEAADDRITRLQALKALRTRS